MQSFHFVPLADVFLSIAQWPLQWLSGVLGRQSIALRKLSMLVEGPSTDAASELAVAPWDLHASAVAAPFNLARAAVAVQTHPASELSAGQSRVHS